MTDLIDQLHRAMLQIIDRQRNVDAADFNAVTRMNDIRHLRDWCQSLQRVYHFDGGHDLIERMHYLGRVTATDSRILFELDDLLVVVDNDGFPTEPFVFWEEFMGASEAIAHRKLRANHFGSWSRFEKVKRRIQQARYGSISDPPSLIAGCLKKFVPPPKTVLQEINAWTVGDEGAALVISGGPADSPPMTS